MKFSYVRELDDYPLGGRRMKILTMAVLASLICSYEGVIAPIVTLLLHDLNMDLATYGSISAAAAIVGAFAGLYGGHLTDKVGRVKRLLALPVHHHGLHIVLCFDRNRAQYRRAVADLARDDPQDRAPCDGQG